MYLAAVIMVAARSGMLSRAGARTGSRLGRISHPDP